MRVDWCGSSWFRIKNAHSLSHSLRCSDEALSPAGGDGGAHVHGDGPRRGARGAAPRWTVRSLLHSKSTTLFAPWWRRAVLPSLPWRLGCLFSLFFDHPFRRTNGVAADNYLCCRGAPAGAEAPGGRRLGARGDWLVARRGEIPIPSRLVRGEGPFDVWKLAKDARKLALYACGRGRADGLGGRREGLIGSTTSLRATSE